LSWFMFTGIILIFSIEAESTIISSHTDKYETRSWQLSFLTNPEFEFIFEGMYMFEILNKIFHFKCSPPKIPHNYGNQIGSDGHNTGKNHEKKEKSKSTRQKPIAFRIIRFWKFFTTPTVGKTRFTRQC